MGALSTNFFSPSAQIARLSGFAFRHREKFRIAAINLGFILAAVLVTQFTVNMLLPLAGLAYVLLFWMLAWHRPDIALVIVFILAPFQNDLGDGSGPSIALAEVHLALTLPVFALRSLLKRRLPHIGPAALPILLYLSVGVFSGILNWYADTSDLTHLIGFIPYQTSNKNYAAIQSLAQMSLYMLAATAVFSSFCRDTRKLLNCFYAMVVVGVLMSVLAPLLLSMAASKLGKNGLGGSLATAAMVSVELFLAAKTRRSKYLLGTATMIIMGGVLFTLSRGALLATATGVLVIMSMRKQFKQMLILILCIVPVGLVWWSLLTPFQREYVTAVDPAKYENIRIRLESVQFALHLFQLQPIYGWGVFLRKQYDATNIALCVLAETGVLGLATFSLIYVALGVMFVRTVRILKPTDPLFSIVVIAAALTYGRLVHGMFDHYWSRGPILNAWASVGMATGVYYIAMQRKRIADRISVVQSAHAAEHDTSNTPWSMIRG